MVQKGLRTVPAEPIRRALEGWIAERDKINERKSPYVGTEIFTGTQQAIFAIWKKDRLHHDKANLPQERVIYRLLDRRDGRTKPKEGILGGKGRRGTPLRQESISFDLADKILTGLGLQHLWQEDPELAEAYQKVDLFVIDLCYPTCDTTREKADQIIWQTYLEAGSVTAAHKLLGVSHAYLKTKIAELRPYMEVPEAA